MGVTESKCVNLVDAPPYLAEHYTVIRTDGKQQDGWQLNAKPHFCWNVDPRQWRPTAHANLTKDGWRVHMSNGPQDEEYPDTHCCGWRRLGMFWPTSLTGDQAAIDAWTETLKGAIEQLARTKGLPIEWADHTCGLDKSKVCEACRLEATAREAAAPAEPAAD